MKFESDIDEIAGCGDADPAAFYEACGQRSSGQADALPQMKKVVLMEA